MYWNDPTLQLQTPSWVIQFNLDTGDTYVNDPQQCAGLDGAPIRATIDDRPQTDGGILHPFYKGARHITLSGTLLVRTAASDGSYVANRSALEDNLVSACDELLNTDGTLSWSGGLRQLTVRCDIAPTYTGSFQKTYVVGLVAADPNIA